MSFGNTELVTVQVSMCVPSGTKYKVIGDVSIAIANINVRIGIRDLHEIAYAYLLPLWLCHSRNFHLSITNTQLCNELHVEMLPRVPDIDAIKEKCYTLKGRARVKTLVTNHAHHVFLHISPRFAEEAEFCHTMYNEKDLPALTDQFVEIDAGTSKSRTRTRTQALTRTTHTQRTRRRTAQKVLTVVETIEIDDSSSEEEPRPSKRQRWANSDQETECLESQPIVGLSADLSESTVDVPPDSMVLDQEIVGRLPFPVSGLVSIPMPQAIQRPKSDAIRDALSKQRVDRKVTLHFQAFVLPKYSWDDLLENPTVCLDLQKNFTPVNTSVTFNPKQKTEQGSFKMCLTDCQTSEVVLGCSHRVCLKRCYHRNEQTGELMNFDSGHQISELSRELNCLLWGKVMLGLVYQFIQRRDVELGTTPSFPIPHLRFVNAALVIGKRTDGEQSVYMMEEIVGGAHGWSFYKYICNGTASPLIDMGTDQAAVEKNRCARFLSFVQHVQFVETDGLAYTSDFQGDGNLLTDPQILTKPELGTNLFARGNVAFDSLFTTHVCAENEFCKHYGPSKEGF
ncbi:hypothetical protein D9758_016101 [Tetrapyrgos nigripes]|uniref:Alpha-type protein kinase domain-containing protein n=1 Tax=Tetrapyrgos nigripes TaxID=182062 RepID=A0A8H5FN39_9AGAR|nr:hypothetical protein D9758_016101 [Tetrapyrgos nigripes]